MDGQLRLVWSNRLLKLNKAKIMKCLRGTVTKHIVQRLSAKLGSRGFTLLELMIALVVVGVLAGMALPTMLRQVGKARETEAINNLSAISFAQQAYFFEFREFAPDYGLIGLSLAPKFFSFPAPDTPANSNYTRSRAISFEAGALNSSRNYAYGTYYVNGTYAGVLCQSPDTVAITQAPTTHTGTCINGTNIK